MKESMWGTFVVMFGIMAVFFILLFQRLITTDEHNYHILREATEGAMYDAVDLSYWRSEGSVRIDREKFVENLIRRIAESATLTDSFHIQVFDVNEDPPKVSIQVSSSESGGNTATTDYFNFSIVSRIDAILETPYTDRPN